MKPAIATVLLVFGVAINLVAQSAYKDTIYLKDKSYYFGFITELVAILPQPRKAQTT